MQTLLEERKESWKEKQRGNTHGGHRGAGRETRRLGDSGLALGGPGLGGSDRLLDEFLCMCVCVCQRKTNKEGTGDEKECVKRYEKSGEQRPNECTTTDYVVRQP